MEKMALAFIDKEQLEKSHFELIQYRYMYWACMRGHIFVVYHILRTHGIYPFLAEKQEKKSPFMVAIENNHEKIARLILSKSYIYS